MKLLETFVTSTGNELEFYKLQSDELVVIDNSCYMERTYVIGQRQILSFDDYDREEKTLITSFEQVIYAWKNEEIYF